MKMTAARGSAVVAGVVTSLATGFAVAAGVARTQPPCWSHSQNASACPNQPSSATSSTSATTTTASTTTVSTTTVTSTTATTTPTTTTGAPTFDSETAYLDTPPPNLTSAIVVSTVSQFTTAIANARAGQIIDVLGNVQVPGEFTGFDRVISGGTVDVVFQPGAGFTGSTAVPAMSSRVPAVYLQNSGGWRLWGGTISNPGSGGGILVHAMPGPFTWTGFAVSNTADTCVAVYPAEGNISGLTLKGVAGTATPNLAYDPHAEKGTGIHAWNLADATGGLLENSTIAADVVSQATGAGVEVDTGQIGPNVTLFTRANHLGFALPGTSWNGDAQTQVAGNVVQLWGGTPPGALDVKYAEGSDIQGRIVESNGVSGSASLSQSTVEYGVATGAILGNPLLSKVAYSLIDAGGVSDHLRLGSVSPLP